MCTDPNSGSQHTRGNDGRGCRSSLMNRCYLSSRACQWQHGKCKTGYLQTLVLSASTEVLNNAEGCSTSTLVSRVIPPARPFPATASALQESALQCTTRGSHLHIRGTTAPFLFSQCVVQKGSRSTCDVYVSGIVSLNMRKVSDPPLVLVKARNLP